MILGKGIIEWAVWRMNIIKKRRGLLYVLYEGG